MPLRVRIGSRGSRLALAQTEWVTALLASRMPHAALEIVITETEGDRLGEAAPDASRSPGAFTRALDGALLDGRIDLVVHSLKDMPLRLAPALTIAATPQREDPRDVFLSRNNAGLAECPTGWVVGTSSPRRRAFLRAVRPDLRVRPIRGNVDTRVRKMREAGEVDALILAAAGLRRLRMEIPVAAHLDPIAWPPAPGQGALGVVARACDELLVAQVRRIEDAAVRCAVTAERAVLAGLGGACGAPVGAYAVVDNDRLVLHAALADPWEGTMARGMREGAAAEAQALGAALAAELLRRGGQAIMDHVRQNHGKPCDDTG